MQDILERAAQVRLVIFDVDGVLTDGSLYLGDDGLEYKAFNARDGHGMVLLQETGVTLAVISGRRSEAVRLRMEGTPAAGRLRGKTGTLENASALRDGSEMETFVFASSGARQVTSGSIWE